MEGPGKYDDACNINTPEGMESAKRWMENLMDLVRDGASWAVPRSATTYQINKADKSFARLVGPGDSAIETVLAEMGWKVII